MSSKIFPALLTVACFLIPSAGNAFGGWKDKPIKRIKSSSRKIRRVMVLRNPSICVIRLACVLMLMGTAITSGSTGAQT